MRAIVLVAALLGAVFAMPVGIAKAGNCITLNDGTVICDGKIVYSPPRPHCNPNVPGCY